MRHEISFQENDFSCTKIWLQIIVFIIVFYSSHVRYNLQCKQIQAGFQRSFRQVAEKFKDRKRVQPDFMNFL